MIITPSTVPFIPQQPAHFEPPLPAESHNADPAQQSLVRNKRGLFGKGRGSSSWFSSKPPAVIPSAPKPKPGPSFKPGSSLTPPGSKFKDVGQTVIHANKVKVNDEAMMANLRKHSPISVAEATKRLIDAESLVKAGVIATGPNASRVARDAFISAGITGLVSAPINVAAYAGSVATGETIKAHYAPGVLPPPFLPGAAAQTSKPQTESVATSEGSISTRLGEVESKLLGMASAVMFVLGDTSSVFTKSESWPKDESGRLSNLEKLLHLSEQHLKKATRQNGIVFKPYKPGETIPGEAKGRLELMEKKLERMTESYEKLRIFAAIKQSEQEEKASITA
ncbi:hypothetical protein [Pseudomonas fluorescens]|nr:hypothetical protein [Pseudomonas fluorescens]